MVMLTDIQKLSVRCGKRNKSFMYMYMYWVLFLFFYGQGIHYIKNLTLEIISECVGFFFLHMITSFE